MHKPLSRKQQYLLLIIGALLIFVTAFGIATIVLNRDKVEEPLIQSQDISSPTAQKQSVENQSAAAEIYPIEVILSEENGQKRITKIYDLPKNISPETLPKEAFEQNGYRYVFLDMTIKENIHEDTKPYQDTLTFDSWTNDFNDVFAMTPKQKEVTTDDGYSGVLELDTNSIRTESAGYSSRSKRYTVTRSYPNLSAADTTYIPKTITENGQTMQLVDIKWQSDNVAQLDGHEMTNRYTAVASYSGTKTTRSSKGYIVTASYNGIVSKVSNETTHYEVMYLGSRIKQTIDWQYPIMAVIVIFLLSLIATLIYWLIIRIKKIEEEDNNEDENRNKKENDNTKEKEPAKIAGAEETSNTGGERDNYNEAAQSESSAPRRHIYGVDDDATVYPGVRQ